MRTLMANSMSNRKFLCWVFGLSAAIASVLVPGCAANREGLAKSGYIALQKNPSDKVYIARCDAYREDVTTLVLL